MIEISREEFVKLTLDWLVSKGAIESKVTEEWKETVRKSFDFYQESDTVLLDREGWQRIKTLIENFPCLSCKSQGIEPNSGECQEELDGMCLDEILKNHEELRKVVMEE